MTNPKQRPITRALHHAIELLDSLADLLGLRPALFRCALVATLELYWRAKADAPDEDLQVQRFVRGFIDVLASLDHDHTRTTTQAALAG
jgi:hypothetical protein